jgi:hypothetical protein
MSTQAIPAEILSAIGPAVEAIREEARQATDGIEYARLAHLARVTARRNGGGEYTTGAQTILTSAFPNVPVPMVDVLRAPLPESIRNTRTCECYGCDDEECDGSCESCEDPYDCPQHRCDEASSCCGWCSDCDSHHGDEADQVFTVYVRSHVTVCPECQHACEYV